MEVIYVKRMYAQLCLLCISVLICGCSGVGSNSVPNESQKEMLSESDLTYVSKTKEVVFTNGWELLYENDIGPQTTHSYNGYGSQFKGSNQLLAYVVDTHSTYSAEHVVSIMRDLGLMVLEDYPYCHYNARESNYGNGLLIGQCVIVGTYDEIYQIFKDTAPIAGVLWQVYPAPRPDIVDYIKKYSDGKDMYQIYDSHYGEIKSELGKEDEIVFSVSVILSEETK